MNYSEIEEENKQKRINQRIKLTNQQLIKEYIKFRKNNNTSIITSIGEEAKLNKLARYLEPKHFMKDVTEKDIQDFFEKLKEYSVKKRNGRYLGTLDIYAVMITLFYRYLFELDKYEKPYIIKWYEYSKKAQLTKISDVDKLKKLITIEEYREIIKIADKIDAKGMYSALFETYYLTGGKLSEVLSMRIKNIKRVGNKFKLELAES